MTEYYIYVKIKTRKQKAVTFALLGVFMFSNTIPYQQFIQKNKQLEIRVESQKQSNFLDVGKDD